MLRRSQADSGSIVQWIGSALFRTTTSTPFLYVRSPAKPASLFMINFQKIRVSGTFLVLFMAAPWLGQRHTPLSVMLFCISRNFHPLTTRRGGGRQHKNSVN